MTQAQGLYDPWYEHDACGVGFVVDLKGRKSHDLVEKALQILDGMFDAGMYFDLNRMPELFCGFRQNPGEGPVLYPVACSPQAWASGVVFHLLQSCLRLSVDLRHARLCVDHAILPPFLTYVRLLNLELPFGQADLLFEQHPLDVDVTVLRQEGTFEVRVIKSEVVEDARRASHVAVPAE